MRCLYDADASIDFLQDAIGTRTTFQRLLPDGIACSVITQIELYTGVYASRDPKTAERQLKALLAVMTTLPLNQKVVRQAARLRYDLVARHLSFRSRAYDL